MRPIFDALKRQILDNYAKFLFLSSAFGRYYCPISISSVQFRALPSIFGHHCLISNATVRCRSRPSDLRRFRHFRMVSSDFGRFRPILYGTVWFWTPSSYFERIRPMSHFCYILKEWIALKGALHSKYPSPPNNACKICRKYCNRYGNIWVKITILVCTKRNIHHPSSR